MIFSTLATLITVPMMFNVVLYEADYHNRTLINRLISSDFMSAIWHNLIVQPLIFARYVFGPQEELFCQVEYLIKNVIILKLILFLDFIIIIRYIFVFKFKNPTAIQEDFWVLFLTIWSIGFAVICQTTVLIFPGKEPMMFYFCLGKMPKSLVNVKVKNNTGFNVLVLLTLFCHTYINVRFMIHKYKQRQRSGVSQLIYPPDNCLLIQSHLLGKLKQENLFTLTTNAGAIATIIMSGVSPNVINRIDPTQIDVFPNYLWVYVHHHITGSVGLLVLNVIYYYKWPQLVNCFKRHFNEMCDEVKKCFDF